jgi:integrase
MSLMFNVFSKPERINLTPTERELWLPSLLRLLRSNPTHVSRVLLGLEEKPWNAKQLREVERLLISQPDNRRQLAGHLSVLHEAARLWWATAGKRVPLPHFLPQERKLDNPFSRDFAHAESVCESWRSELSRWIDQLRDTGSGPSASELRFAAFVISSILYGQILGAPYLVALIRAIPERNQRTFILERVHVELSLSRKGVLDAAHRIWLPDALTATLWSKVEPTDAQDLLAPEIRKDGQGFAPSDGTVWRRFGKLIRRLCAGHEGNRLVGVEELRLSAREVALADCTPNFVAYSNNEFASESLRRCDVGRLFPGAPLLEIDSPAELITQAEKAGDVVATPPEPGWMDTLRRAARSDSATARLAAITGEVTLPDPLRVVADFGLAIASRTSRHGKRLPVRKIAHAVVLIGRSLGFVLEHQDLATLEPNERRQLYVDSVNVQPASVRRDLVQAIREFDLYLVAKNTTTLPIPRNSLPWFSESESVDPNLITPREYRDILGQIEVHWPARSGERRRKMVRLLVIVAFRCGLRRSELRALRIEDLLTLGHHWLHVRYRSDDPLKTRNAERRIPLEVLVPRDEWIEIYRWLQLRAEERAKATDYLFASSDGTRIRNSLFDDLNSFLRNATRYANGGKGLHLHHCRHSFGTWLFVSLVLSNAERKKAFPTLDQLSTWLPDQTSLYTAIYRHTKPTKKAPFVTARLCGHLSFDTTASSYLHIYPWLVAHEIDHIDTLKPDPELVRKASGAPLKDSKHWLREGGVHNIPVQLLLAQASPRVAENTLELCAKCETSAQSKHGGDWLLPAWSRVVRHALGEPAPAEDADLQRMLARAKWLGSRRNATGKPRHLMEKVPKHIQMSADSSMIRAPLKPPNFDNSLSPALQAAVGSTDINNSEIRTDAVHIFAKRYERDGFVKFDSILDIANADHYIQFLRGLGFQKRELELVSGDPSVESCLRRQWREQLKETYLSIRSCPRGRCYSPKTSLWIRPSVTALAKRHTGPAGFRFTMAMAFIVFGTVDGKHSATKVGTN